MFKKKTVFILGAGASWHYGYPTGEELVRSVKAKAFCILHAYHGQNGPSGKTLAHHPETYPKHLNNRADFNDFLHRLSAIDQMLEQANPLVIDDFLDRNEGIASIGKILIAMVLFDCEKEAKIRSGKIDEKTKQDTGKGDWIRYIVQQLTVGCKVPSELLDNQVTFVTFNYDLSLESRLHQALENYQYFAGGGVLDEFFTKERFLHVYGQICELDPAHPGVPENSYNNAVFPLANEIDRAHDAAHGIFTISSEKSAAREIVEAIAKAEYLYFLGYGFDKRNNELLRLGWRWALLGKQNMCFTNLGNSNKVSKSVEQCYIPSQRQIDENGEALGSLIGDHYLKRSMQRGVGPKYICEKSIKSVYDALAQDFDWPE
jgi:hypothetical protein